MINKKLAIIIGGVVMIGAIYTGYFLYSNSKVSQDDITTEILKNDNDGGNTPQETINLFIKALERGNPDEASKYFEVSQQDEWRGSLNIIKDSGVLDEMALDFTKNLKPDPNSDEKTGEFRYFIENEGVNLVTIILKINPYTKVWKISDL